jgi:hypothetical protein
MIRGRGRGRIIRAEGEHIGVYTKAVDGMRFRTALYLGKVAKVDSFGNEWAILQGTTICTYHFLIYHAGL